MFVMDRVYLFINRIYFLETKFHGEGGFLLFGTGD
jgi:hypothetical protein